MTATVPPPTAERLLAARTATPSARSSLTVVVPVHDEAESIPAFVAAVVPVLEGLDLAWDILFVDDGSGDGSAAILAGLARGEPRIRVLGLARNFGKDAALTAGLDFAGGDAVVPMDADLQDPPAVLPELVAAWRAGADIVDARRSSRAGDALVVRFCARVYYRLMARLLQVRIAPDVGDFRLIDRRVLAAIAGMRERNRFFKGMVAWPGFATASVAYVRPPRRAGRSSWSLWRLWNFALDGIVGYSSAPLRIWLYLGLAVSGVSFLYGSALVFRKLVFGADMPGYTSLMAAILFLGGVQLVVLGVLGEYLGRMYDETKGRPLYVVSHAEGIDLSPPAAPPG